MENGTFGLKEQKRKKNLLKAFAGESQARSRYTFFASVAKKEGYEQIADILWKPRNRKRKHAKRSLNSWRVVWSRLPLLTLPEKIGTTAENLLAAAEGEYEEWDELYPHFAKVAEEEGFRLSLWLSVRSLQLRFSMKNAYRKLLERVEKGEVFSREEPIEWMCRNCGYVHYGRNSFGSLSGLCAHSKAIF